MRLGTDTGSMSNYLMSGTNGAPQPVVGMGCTILMWTDRHAATIYTVHRRILTNHNRDSASKKWLRSSSWWTRRQMHPLDRITVALWLVAIGLIVRYL